MSAYYESARATIYHGDCRDIMEGQLPDNWVDSIVTDPPYELGFMGKGWDNSGIAYNTEVWENAYRILKPGGHLLAFGGTRTWHRLAAAIEDAGFEVRDSIAWMYGSGFPKSLDVSKAIDKRGGAQVAWFGPWFRKWREDKGVTQKEVAALFPSKSGGLTGCVANWELGFNMPTPDQFNLLRDTFGLPFDSITEAEREVVGKANGTHPVNHINASNFADGAQGRIKLDITVPATPAAQQWQGWGTALKPAFEPIVVARKPLIGTVAENVQAHGTGALNIDGCRIGADGGARRGAGDVGQDACTNAVYGKGLGLANAAPKVAGLGRWPANVILDESQAAELDRQSGVTKDGVAVRHRGVKGGEIGAPGAKPEGTPDMGYGGTGGASRFFYCAKAPKKERPNVEGVAHPTVKPLKLMEYLCRLVTPPGGTILEPFAGSGTTIEAALNEGFNVIGIEMTDEYLPLIMARIQRHGEKLC